MRINLNIFYFYVVYLSIIGFPIIATFSQILSLSSTPFSIFIRSIIFLLSLLLIVFSIKYIFILKRYHLLVAFIVFWFFYIYRLIDITFFQNYNLPNSTLYYWIWGLGTCFFPFLAISFFQIKDFKVFKNIFSKIFYSLIVLAPLVIIYGSTEISSDDYYGLVDTGRFRLRSLNPISVGSLGALLMLFSLWYYFELKPKNLKKIMLLTGFLLGAYLLLLANSRGPIIASFLTLFFIFVKYIRPDVFFKTIVILFLVSLSMVFFNIDAVLDNHRFFSSSSVSSALEDSRFDIYSNSISIFFNNPIIGKYIIDPITGFYSHNLIIEAFMSTGFLGGIIFLISLLSVLYISILCIPKEFIWISIFFIYNLSISMLSGAIYNSIYFWISCGLVISFFYSYRNNRL